MWMLVAYDVCTLTPAGRRRLARVARIATGYGQRVQHSVFELYIDETTWITARMRLLDAIDRRQDSLRFYHLGEGPSRRDEVHGVGPRIDPEAPLVFDAEGDV